MAGKCVTYTSKDAKQVKLDEQIRDESVTPTLILSTSVDDIRLKIKE